ncbi:sensor histidine kinase [Nitriliruptor alkaliphilus]|uniref:sensor histidine kinase n=1 Tax=Nitriliruptor alkaliphilus TaxID=427918 RepID=UPI00069627FA|nr:PAS domain S-box protein [Nitriliruptor alkaliphilus]
MEQARITDATIAEFLRAIADVPDRAPLDDLSAAVERFADRPGDLPATLAGVLDLEIRRRTVLDELSLRDEELEEHRRLHAVLHLQLAVVALDLEGRITAWNQGAERLLGWSATDVEGTRLQALLPADASGNGLDALRRIVEAGGSLESFEVRLRHQDGRFRELEGSMSPLRDAVGRATGYSVIYRDVGERNVALRRLAENEQLFRRLAESSQDVVYRAQFDQLLPHVEYVSPSARQRLGFDAAQLVADPDLFSSRIHPDDRDEAVGADSWDAEDQSRLRFRFQHADGRWLWLDDRRSPLTDPEGRVVGLSGVLRDITSEVESEQRLRATLERERRAADQLRRVDQMKTTFLSAVSHELRTPLTSILGFALTADRALSHRDRHDPVLTYVRRIVANAERLQALIGDLLDVDRLAREAPEPRRVRLDVADLVRDLARRADRAGRRLYVEVPGSCEADVDVLMVERTVHSLLDNALRHTPAGTQVTVRLTADETHLSLVVEDDGPGVPEPERAGLFAPFAQGEGAATAANPGTGIGLALVDRFVRVHGGQVHLDERPGGGARVTVDLPRWGPDDAVS